MISRAPPLKFPIYFLFNFPPVGALKLALEGTKGVVEGARAAGSSGRGGLAAAGQPKAANSQVSLG
jgi:hypothetical protein